jgi:hypothetical protein
MLDSVQISLLYISLLRQRGTLHYDESLNLLVIVQKMHCECEPTHTEVDILIHLLKVWTADASLEETIFYHV